MQTQTEFETEVANLIVDALNLEDVQAHEIDPEAPLFDEGLALDSIDALELALAIMQRYSVELKSEDADIRKVFGSLRNLSAYIAAKNS
jgi:acyl carrier protein